MLAAVTNRAKAPRGFATLDRGVVTLEPGQEAVLDLADHPAHAAWAESGAIALAPLSDRDAKAARKRLEAEATEAAKARSEALARLPSARPADGTLQDQHHRPGAPQASPGSRLSLG